ncbi:hypothetical protein BJX76DRAFT_361506 [Aspergillus varians]
MSGLFHAGLFPMSYLKAAETSSNAPCDIVLPMQNPYMDQIIRGQKSYEFKKYCLEPSVKKIWFYQTAPLSSITHVCETLPARTRKPGDTPLDEDGLGNAEFNGRDKDWEGMALHTRRSLSMSCGNQ